MKLPFLFSLIFALGQGFTPQVESTRPPAQSTAAIKLRTDEDAAARSAVDRTAMWIGDPLIYTVRVVCAPGVDVLDDDLAGDKLKLDGLEFVKLDTLREAGPGGMSIRTFRYQLTTYKVEQSILKIGDISARYYRVRPGQGVEGGEAAGQVSVPGATVAFRSMLPDDMEASQIRDAKDRSTRPQLFAVAAPIGAGLLIASVIPALLWVIGFVQARMAPRKERKSTRQVKKEAQTTLESVREMDLSAVETRREAYAKIAGLVRGHLRDGLGVPTGPSLTPAEAEAALAGKPSRVPTDAIRTLLTQCDAARYSPPQVVPTADACREAITEADRILSIRAR